MTLDGSRIDDSEENAKQQLYNGLGFYGRFQAQHDPHVNGLVQELQNKSVFPKRTVPYTAVIVNKGVKPYAIEM